LRVATSLLERAKAVRLSGSCCGKTISSVTPKANRFWLSTGSKQKLQDAVNDRLWISAFSNRA